MQKRRTVVGVCQDASSNVVYFLAASRLAFPIEDDLAHLSILLDYTSLVSHDRLGVDGDETYSECKVSTSS